MNKTCSGPVSDTLSVQIRNTWWRKITVFIYSTALTSVRIETFRSNQEENVTIWFPMLVVRHESLNTAPAGGGGGGGGGGGHSASPAPNHPKDRQQELISGTYRQYVYFNACALSLWTKDWFTVSLNTQSPTLYPQKYYTDCLNSWNCINSMWHINVFTTSISISVPLAAPYIATIRSCAKCFTSNYPEQWLKRKCRKEFHSRKRKSCILIIKQSNFRKSITSSDQSGQR